MFTGLESKSVSRMSKKKRKKKSTFFNGRLHVCHAISICYAVFWYEFSINITKYLQFLLECNSLGNTNQDQATIIHFKV